MAMTQTIGTGIIDIKVQGQDKAENAFSRAKKAAQAARTNSPTLTVPKPQTTPQSQQTASQGQQPGAAQQPPSRLGTIIQAAKDFGGKLFSSVAGALGRAGQAVASVFTKGKAPGKAQGKPQKDQSGQPAKLNGEDPDEARGGKGGWTGALAKGAGMAATAVLAVASATKAAIGGVMSLAAVADPVRYERLSWEFEKMQMTIGRLVIPIVKELIGVMQMFNDWLKNSDFANWVKGVFLDGFTAAKGVIANLWASFKPLIDAALKLVQALEPVLALIIKIGAAVGGWVISAALQLITFLVEGLTETIETLVDVWDAAWGAMGGVLSPVIELLSTVWGWLNKIVGLLAGLLKMAGSAVLGAVDKMTGGRLSEARKKREAERADRTKRGRESGEFAPEMRLTPQMMGISDIYKRAQTASQGFDKETERHREMMNALNQENDKLDKIYMSIENKKIGLGR